MKYLEHFNKVSAVSISRTTGDIVTVSPTSEYWIADFVRSALSCYSKCSLGLITFWKEFYVAGTFFCQILTEFEQNVFVHIVYFSIAVVCVYFLPVVWECCSANSNHCYHGFSYCHLNRWGSLYKTQLHLVNIPVYKQDATRHLSEIQGFFFSFYYFCIDCFFCFLFCFV